MHERGRVPRSESIAALYDTYGDEVYRFIYRRCRDHSLSQDITQETFLTALRGPTEPENITAGWLITVARNRLFDALRRQVSYEQRLELLIGGAEDGRTEDISERLRVEAALQKLSVDHRLVLTLHYVDGYTVPALGDHLGRSSKSVEALVTRARRALRAELEQSNETERRTYG